MSRQNACDDVVTDGKVGNVALVLCFAPPWTLGDMLCILLDFVLCGGEEIFSEVGDHS